MVQIYLLESPPKHHDLSRFVSLNLLGLGPQSLTSLSPCCNTCSLLKSKSDYYLLYSVFSNFPRQKGMCVSLDSHSALYRSLPLSWSFVPHLNFWIVLDFLKDNAIHCYFLFLTEQYLTHSKCSAFTCPSKILECFQTTESSVFVFLFVAVFFLSYSGKIDMHQIVSEIVFIQGFSLGLQLNLLLFIALYFIPQEHHMLAATCTHHLVLYLCASSVHCCFCLKHPSPC